MSHYEILTNVSSTCQLKRLEANATCTYDSQPSTFNLIPPNYVDKAIKRSQPLQWRRSAPCWRRLVAGTRITGRGYACTVFLPRQRIIPRPITGSFQSQPWRWLRKQLVSGTATMQLLSYITVLFPESSSTALKPLPSVRLWDPHGALLDRDFGEPSDVLGHSTAIRQHFQPLRSAKSSQLQTPGWRDADGLAAASSFRAPRPLDDVSISPHKHWNEIMSINYLKQNRRTEL